MSVKRTCYVPPGTLNNETMTGITPVESDS